MGLVLHEDKVFVADCGNDRLVCLDKETLALVSSLSDTLKAPRDVAVSGNEIFVCDSGNHRVAVLSARYMTILRSIQDKSWGVPEHEHMAAPLAVAVGHGRLYVTDSSNRLHIMSLYGEPLQVLVLSSGGEMQGVAAGEDHVYVTRGDNMEHGPRPVEPPGGEEGVVVVLAVPDPLD
eukprot:364408-Prymnesium_polylepis.2